MHVLVLIDDSEFLYQEADSGSIMRYNAATNTQVVFVNNSFDVSINRSISHSVFRSGRRQKSIIYGRGEPESENQGTKMDPSMNGASGSFCPG